MPVCESIAVPAVSIRHTDGLLLQDSASCKGRFRNELHKSGRLDCEELDLGIRKRGERLSSACNALYINRNDSLVREDQLIADGYDGTLSQ